MEAAPFHRLIVVSLFYSHCWFVFAATLIFFLYNLLYFFPRRWDGCQDHLGIGKTLRVGWFLLLFCSVLPWLIVVFIFSLLFFCGCNLGAGECWDCLVQVGWLLFFIAAHIFSYFFFLLFSWEGVPCRLI